MLFVISGPSGVGKGTLIDRLICDNPHLSLAVSATTRAPRNGEVHGESYYFLSKAAFQQHIDANHFLEWCNVHQHQYGTLKSEIEQKLQRHAAVLIEIDVQGAKKIKQQTDTPQYHIFIAPPSIDALKNRLQKRNTENDDVIMKRLNIAEIECKEQHNYDEVIVNNELTQSLNELNNVIQRTLTKGVT